MITKELAVKIWSCHEQIESAQKLITDMADILKKDEQKQEPKLSNAFGERVGLQLGVPSGDSSHRLFGVNPDLSIKIIEQHIEDNKKRLQELMALAKIELYPDQPTQKPEPNLNQFQQKEIPSKYKGIDSREIKCCNNNPYTIESGISFDESNGANILAFHFLAYDTNKYIYQETKHMYLNRDNTDQLINKLKTLEF